MAIGACNVGPKATAGNHTNNLALIIYNLCTFTNRGAAIYHKANALFVSPIGQVIKNNVGTQKTTLLGATGASGFTDAPGNARFNLGRSEGPYHGHRGTGLPRGAMSPGRPRPIQRTES
jgi:hypothetical protein